MANFFKDIGDSVVDQVKAPFKGISGALSNVVKGDFGDAWDDLRHIPGDMNRGLSKGYKAVIGDNWISQNPLEATAIAAAIAAGGTAAMGALGGGSGAAAGTVGGGSMASGSSFIDPMLGFESSGSWLDTPLSGSGGGWLDSASNAIGSSDSFGGFGNSSNTGYAGSDGLWKKSFGEAMEAAGKAMEGYKGQEVRGAGSVGGGFSGGGGSFKPVQIPKADLSYLDPYTSPFTSGFKV